MTVLYILSTILCGVIVCQLAVIVLLYRMAETERGRLIEQYERRIGDLMDRIQAPSFAEYAGKVIREKVVDQKKKDDEEKQIEFVS